MTDDYPDIEPASPLPWSASRDVVAISRAVDLRDIEADSYPDDSEDAVAQYVRTRDAHYIATACSLYPKLREEVMQLRARLAEIDRKTT